MLFFSVRERVEFNNSCNLQSDWFLYWVEFSHPDRQSGWPAQSVIVNELAVIVRRLLLKERKIESFALFTPP